MKKLFAIVAVIRNFTFGSIQLARAQDAPAAEQTEQQAAPAAGSYYSCCSCCRRRGWYSQGNQS